MATTTTTTTPKQQAQPMQEAPATNLPAPRPRTAISPIVPQNWQEVTAIAGAICRAGMAPKSYCKVDNYNKLIYVDGKPVADPEKVAIGIMHGMEVGMTPMASLQSIAVINGMPSLYGDGLLAVIRASDKLEDIEEFIERDKDGPVSATCKMWRKGEKTPSIQVYTRADAQKAKLWGKAGPWTDHPARMLQWRARGWCGRDKFADVLRGLHSAEEMEDLYGIIDIGGASIVPAAEPRRSDFTDKSSAAPHAADTGAADPKAAASTAAEVTPGQGASEGGGSGPADVAAPSSDQPSAQQGMITDVEDLNQQPEEKVEFTKYKSLKEFVNFSDHFLQDGATTAGMARQWEEFYRQDMHHVRQNPKATAPSIQALDDLMTLYNAKVGQERQPGEEG